MAQVVDLRGTVTDRNGSPVSGAKVSLSKAGLSAYTDAVGAFRITDASGSAGRPIAGEGKTGFSAAIRDGTLRMVLAAPAEVGIDLVSLTGKLLWRVSMPMGAGVNVVPLTSLTPGLGFCVIRYQGAREVFKVQCSGNGISIMLSGQAMKAVSKRAKISAIRDLLFVTKVGLLDYCSVISSVDTSGVVIVLLPNEGTIKDADGHEYQTVKIGNQVWTASNLRATRYIDNTPIPQDQNDGTWADATTPKFCFNTNAKDTNTQKIFGALYNFYVVDPSNPKKVAPAGWRVASEADWNELQNFLVANGYNWDSTTTGNKAAKSLAQKAYWSSSTLAGAIGNDLLLNNKSGFSAVPSGYRHRNGMLDGTGILCLWWTSTKKDGASAVSREIGWGSASLQTANTSWLPVGIAVRLVKN